MTQNTARIEPTFGETHHTNSSESASGQAPTVKIPLSFSVHSKKSPGHTFTPILKRSADLAQHTPTLEEQEMLNQSIPNKPADFAFTPAEEDNLEQDINATTEHPQPTVSESESATEKEEVPHIAAVHLERVMPAQSSAKSPKTAVDQMPTRYRRLLLVMLLGLALLAAFFLLKPSMPETVEALQEQGSSLPIEFRPVDEEEAKRAEAAEEALRQQQEADKAAAQLPQAAQLSENSANPISVAEMGNIAPTNTVDLMNPPPIPTVESAKTITPMSIIEAVEVNAEPIKNTVSSEAPTPPPAKPVAKKVGKANIAGVKTVSNTKKVDLDSSPVLTTSALKTKVLVVQKGVTLFQNFRNNGLGDNLPELNKMTKLNGKTSELKAGQKIIIRLDDKKRIVEMNIGSGRYIRQADGSYIYR